MLSTLHLLLQKCSLEALINFTILWDRVFKLVAHPYNPYLSTLGPPDADQYYLKKTFCSQRVFNHHLFTQFWAVQFP